jgi:hypothetical protein
MKKSDITKIFNMCQTQRQSFKANYPTAESLANAINNVIMGDAVKEAKKDYSAKNKSSNGFKGTISDWIKGDV